VTYNNFVQKQRISRAGIIEGSNIRVPVKK